MKRALAVLSMLITSFSYANHNCVGLVNTVDISGRANVQVGISGIGTGNILCSLDSNLGEYTAEACKGVLSLAMSAMMSGKNLRLYFRNDTDTTCSKGDWNNFGDAEYQLYYIRLEN